MKTVVGLFDDQSEAQHVYDALLASGFAQTAVTLVTSGDTLGLTTADGIPEADITVYKEGVQHGGALVIVRVDDAKADDAADIMARFKMVDIDARETDIRQRSTVSQGAAAGDQVLPVIEEEIKIGKRAVEGGRTRVYTTVTETPVEEQVTLHEERINVERRPVDRAVTDADVANAFKEQSFEVTAIAEEAVVAKTARVIEEVVIGKQATERTETIRDTVRRTDVNVEEVPASGVVSDMVTDVTTAHADAATTGTTRTVSTTGYDTYANDYRTYYDTNLTNSGYTYEQLSPVYRYGYDLANDDRYHNQDWATFESDARTSWEERNPGTWEQFKDTVRYAWDKARGAR